MTEHLTDDELAMYAFDPAFDPNRALTESHLDDCAECLARLAVCEQFERALADPDTWDVADGITDPSTSLQALRALAAQDAAEDQEASRLLGPLLSAPAALVWANLAAKRRYQTAGVARLLTNTAQQSCEREPLHALNYSDLAIEIGRHLSEDRYSGNTLADLRGGAWKARANALRYLGHFNAALDALEQADREYRRLPHAGIGLAAVKYVRATILRERDNFDLALREAHESAEAFAHLGQTDRYIAARNVEGQILFSTKRFAEARTLFLRILAYGENNGDESWIGRAALNLGHTHLVSNDCALVTLDIIDCLLATEDTAEVISLAAGLVETFLASGKVSGALTAVAYLKEAAASRQLTVPTIDYVRKFLLRAERRPTLQFTPPPGSQVL